MEIKLHFQPGWTDILQHTALKILKNGRKRVWGVYLQILAESFQPSWILVFMSFSGADQVQQPEGPRPPDSAPHHHAGGVHSAPPPSLWFGLGTKKFLKGPGVQPSGWRKVLAGKKVRPMLLFNKIPTRPQGVGFWAGRGVGDSRPPTGDGIGFGVSAIAHTPPVP